MENNIKVNIRLTLKDVRDFVFAQSYGSIFKKIGMIFPALLFLLCIFSFVIVSSTDVAKDMALVLFVSLIPVLIIAGISVVPVLIKYKYEKNNFIKSKLLQKLQCIELKDDAILFSSYGSNTCYKWSDIHMVCELKPCFLISTAPNKNIIIPRRCFNDAAQLNMFLDMLKTKIDKKKLKLKMYKINKFSPDYGETVSSQQSVEEPAEASSLTPLAEVKFAFNKSEILGVTYRTYYTNPAGIGITIAGIIFMIISVKNLLSGNISGIGGLLPGIICTLLIPILFYISVSKQFEKDTSIKGLYHYKFYSDGFFVNYANGSAQIKWSDLVKIVERNTAFFFYQTTQNAYVIPKRVFEGKEEELEALRKIIEERK